MCTLNSSMSGFSSGDSGLINVMDLVDHAQRRVSLRHNPYNPAYLDTLPYMDILTENKKRLIKMER